MDRNCIFCKIVAKEMSADIVYEDKECLAFFDIHPVTDGHLLLIPKAHWASVTDTPDELLAKLFITAKKLMPALRQATKTDYVTLSVVGTDVPHLHIHIIPRAHKDGLANFWPTKVYNREKSLALGILFQSLKPGQSFIS